MWKGKIFFQFLFSYIMVMLIPITVSAVAYNNTVKIVEYETQEASLSTLEHCMVILDRRLAEVDNIVTQLSLNTEVLSFSKKTSPYIDLTLPYRINKLQQEVAALTFGNDFIEMLCVYFKKPDVIISDTHSFLSSSQFYDVFVKYGDMSISEWRDIVLDNENLNGYFPATTTRIGFEGDIKNLIIEPMLMYIRSFPAPTSNCGKIIIFIPASRIRELFLDINIEKGGWAYITDSQGKTLFVFSASAQDIYSNDIYLEASNGSYIQRIKGQKMIVNCKTSAYNGWKYIAVTPYSVVMERAQYVKQMIKIMLIISMFLGLVGALFATYHNCKPIRSIIEILQKISGGRKATDVVRNEYKYLRSSILNLISDNKKLQENFKKQLPHLKTIFIERLLYGNFSNNNEIEWFLDQLKIIRFSKRIGVAISQMDNHMNSETDSHVVEMSAVKLILQETIDKYFGVNVYYHDLDFDKLVIIFGIDEDNIDEKRFVEEMLSNVRNDIYKIHNISIYFTVGSLVDDYTDISRSFDEAKEALDYKVLNKDKSILWYSEIPKSSESYYYPMNIENRLINFAKLGDAKKIHAALKRVYKENFVIRKLSPTMMIQLIYELKGTLLKSLDILSINYTESTRQIVEKIEDLENSKSIDDIFISIFEIFDEICSLSEKNSKNDIVINNIIEYIYTNYKDSQLSLVKIAEQFGFSPAYLSQLFKEKTGKNLSVYLEQIRIEKACKLLLEGVSVSNAAQEVGYNSVYVFRKAFKRNLGMTPSEYRSNIELQEFIL